MEKRGSAAALPLFSICFYPDMLSLFLLLAEWPPLKAVLPDIITPRTTVKRYSAFLRMPFMKDLISPNNPYFLERI